LSVIGEHIAQHIFSSIALLGQHFENGYLKSKPFFLFFSSSDWAAF
jgi:hypothetical protein